MMSHEAMTKQALTIIDALIDGIRVADAKVRDRSSQALRAIGIRVLPRLSEVVDKRSTTPRQRSQLRELIERFPAFENPAANISQLIANALIESLRTRDARLTNKVMAALRELPPTIVSPLIFAAAAQRKSRGYCLKLLRAVRELGHPVTGSGRIAMVLLIQPTTDPLIQEEAARVMALEHQTTVILCSQAQ